MLEENEKLKTIIQEIKINNTAIEVIKQQNITSTINQTKALCIKIALIISCSCLAGVSLWYFYYCLKLFCFNYLFALPMVNNFLNTWFYKTISKSISVEDRFGNIYTVDVSKTQKIVEIHVRPYYSEITYALEDFLELDKSPLHRDSHILNDTQTLELVVDVATKLFNST